MAALDFSDSVASLQTSLRLATLCRKVPVQKPACSIQTIFGSYIFTMQRGFCGIALSILAEPPWAALHRARSEGAGRRERSAGRFDDVSCCGSSTTAAQLAVHMEFMSALIAMRLINYSHGESAPPSSEAAPGFRSTPDTFGVVEHDSENFLRRTKNIPSFSRDFRAIFAAKMADLDVSGGCFDEIDGACWKGRYATPLPIFDGSDGQIDGRAALPPFSASFIVDIFYSTS
ncbi:hypothetical protein C8R45DRAFT_938012 [Mycena sanguinolenta]|nr:hypothetical protein C8R45DRAFT_938012 [Mycena sanguinolenta]